MKARFLALWTAAVLAAAAAFVVHLTLRFENVRLGYEVGDARRAQRKLVESRRMLAVEAATLRQPDRIEAVARTTLQMQVADAPRIIAVDARRRRTSGRAQ